MSNGRIVLLTGSSLCYNPRAFKAANTLARAGYDVVILGAWLEPQLKYRDQPLVEHAPFRFLPVVDVTRSEAFDASAQLWRRVRRKAACAWHGITGLESPRQLGVTTTPLLARALAIEADLFIAHSEPGMYVARELRRHGRSVGVDFEDWFSEDLSPNARRGRPLRLLRFLERELVTGGAYVACPSLAMSAAIAARYGGPPPAVLYNAFAWRDRTTLDGRCKDRRDRRLVSIHWCSQTLGPGRGIEDLIDAMPLLSNDAEFHFRGRPVPGMEKWIRSRLTERWQRRVVFHPTVGNDELLSRIAEHDIGFAGESPNCRSRDLTVTNKLLHYLLAGLAVVASDTAGQREAAERAKGAIGLYPPGNPTALAQLLDRLIGTPGAMACAKEAALRAAQNFFCWEEQEGILLNGIDATLPVGASRRAQRLPVRGQQLRSCAFS